MERSSLRTWLTGEQTSAHYNRMKEQTLGPSTCPWCGLTKKVYVRAGSELVCTDCVREFEASEGSA